jgi:hypothetical protein
MNTTGSSVLPASVCGAKKNNNWNLKPQIHKNRSNNHLSYEDKQGPPTRSPQVAVDPGFDKVKPPIIHRISRRYSLVASARTVKIIFF